MLAQWCVAPVPDEPGHYDNSDRLVQSLYLMSPASRDEEHVAWMQNHLSKPGIAALAQLHQ